MAGPIPSLDSGGPVLCAAAGGGIIGCTSCGDGDREALVVRQDLIAAGRDDALASLNLTTRVLLVATTNSTPSCASMPAPSDTRPDSARRWRASTPGMTITPGPIRTQTRAGVADVAPAREFSSAHIDRVPEPVPQLVRYRSAAAPFADASCAYRARSASWTPGTGSFVFAAPAVRAICADDWWLEMRYSSTTYPRRSQYG